MPREQTKVLKMTDVMLNNLKVLLQSIDRGKFYDNRPLETRQKEGLGPNPVQNKWQALTMFRKILLNIDETNKKFGENLDEIQKVFDKYIKEWQAFNTGFQELTKEEKDKNPDALKKQSKEKEDFQTELVEKRNKELAELKDGFKIIAYANFMFLDYIDEKNRKEVSFELEISPHNQFGFIQDQMNRNLYNVNVPVEIIAELAEILMEE